MPNLNRRCIVQYKAVSQDANYGTDVITWTQLAVLWCEKQDVLPSRSESVKSGLSVSANQARFRFRLRTDINSSMRFIVGGVTYQIISGPAELNDRMHMEFVAERYSS